jgi:thioester reductase-like protein
VITPPSEQDYLVISGDANSILRNLVTTLGLDALFTVPQDASTIVLPETQVDRYAQAYTVLLKIFRNNGGKLVFRFHEGMCEVSCVPLVDYSQDEEFNSDQLTFVINKVYNTVNHLICLGKGELKDRQRIDLYVDADGNISRTQTITGLDEITEVYDYSSVESLDELEKEGREEIASRREDGKVEATLTETQEFDISDIIGATEEVTHTIVTKHISKKIVTISNDKLLIDYNING